MCRWAFLTILLVAFPAGAASGQQDLSFLQSMVDNVVVAMEVQYEATFTHRYIDASDLQRAFASRDLPVPSMDEVRAAFHRPDERQFVVDSFAAALEFGPPDAPEFLEYIARRGPRRVREGRPPPVAPDEVQWVRNDGVIVQFSTILPRPRDGEYLFTVGATITLHTGTYSQPFGGIFARRDGEWVKVPR